MRLTGRHRMKTHGGIPYGSTCNLAAKLDLYLEGNTREKGSSWRDRSVNVNHASQTTSANQPSGVVGGGLDFEDTDDAGTASMMDFTSFNVPVNTDFLMFIVWNPETVSSSAYLSDGTSEVFQQTNGGVTLFKTSGATNSMNHASTFAIDTGEKSVFMIHRTNGSTGTIKLYKNGLVHDPSVTDTTTFDLQNLGSKNDAANWFDGIIYDVGVVQGASATDKVRDMVTDYLCAKHGIGREGNY
tara:strand:- start:18 stop:743 length:726 start_codon:yes stop_codon:yes gene_type:complete